MSSLLGRLGMTAALLVALASSLTAQDSPEGLLAEAERIYGGANGSTSILADVRALLDRIVRDHPSSDLALSVLLAEPVGEIDVAGLNAAIDSTNVLERPIVEEAIEAASSEDIVPDSVTLETVAPVVLTVGSEASEAALGFDAQDIRDLQARLLVLGHDPNGVDGLIGPGTRSAISGWQVAQGFDLTGYLNSGQHSRLQATSEAALVAWRADPANERTYLPPPPIALGPGNVTGNWRYTTNCGAGSRLGRIEITGILAINHAGGSNYTGTLSNSQGFRGRVSATLRGRSVTSVTNFGLLMGRVSLTARVDDHRLVMRGRDSNGCSFYAVKS